MDHFEAVTKMRSLAEGNDLREIIIEIDWDAIKREHGYNVEGKFKDSDDKSTYMYWDANHQDMQAANKKTDIVRSINNA